MADKQGITRLLNDALGFLQIFRLRRATGNVHCDPPQRELSSRLDTAAAADEGSERRRSEELPAVAL